jgi:hypothetical protein
MITKTIFVALCLVFCISGSRAQTPVTPPSGSSARREIMDVLRVPVERDLRQKVVFRVQHLRVIGEWALARVVPIRPDGSDIDYSKTKYREENAEGVFDGEGEALLSRRGGRWKLLEWRFGASDTEVRSGCKNIARPQR